MDPSHVAMVNLELPPEVFQEYECTQPLTIRLSLDNLIKLLKRTKSEEIIELSYNEETKKVEIIIKNEIIKEFKIPTLEPIEEETPTPKIVFKSKVKMTSTAFRDIIEDAHALSDSVSLEADEEKILVISESDLSSARFEVDKKSPAIIELTSEELSKASFNLTYLNDIIKAGAGASEVINFEFSKDMPLRLEFPLPQSGTLTYYLAPRIEAE